MEKLLFSKFSLSSTRSHKGQIHAPSGEESLDISPREEKLTALVL